MPRLFLLFLFLACLSLTGCETRTSEIRAIYQTLFEPYKNQDLTFYISEIPARLPTERFSKAVSLQDFDFGNTEKHHTSDAFGTVHAHLLKGSELDEIFAHGCVEAQKTLRARYPNLKVLLSISTVGLNASRNEAVVFYEAQSNCIGTSGHVAHFTKKGGVWMQDKHFNLWVS